MRYQFKTDGKSVKTRHRRVLQARPDVVLGIDPGYTTGLAITQKTSDGIRVLWCADIDLKLREFVRNNESRRAHRRQRRRGKGRPSRFSNRGNARQKGRVLEPIRSAVDMLARLIRNVRKEHPFGAVVVEHAAFDLQALQSQTEMQPEDYQRGPRYGLMNTKAYLRSKQYNHCAYCGQLLRGKASEIDHVIPRRISGGGSLGNLVLACRKCNGRKSGRTPERLGRGSSGRTYGYGWRGRIVG